MKKHNDRPMCSATWLLDNCTTLGDITVDLDVLIDPCA